MSTWDKVSDQRILSLHPNCDIRVVVEKFVNHCYQELGIALRVTDGYRDIKTQEDKYAQGRTKPGKIVTRARGGFSFHNYGFAFDVVSIVNGQPDYNFKDWLKIGEAGEMFGLEWGGRWLSDLQKKLPQELKTRAIQNGDGFDKPHFQKTYGLTISQCFDQYAHGFKYPVIL